MTTLPSPWIEQNGCLSEDDVLAFQRGDTSESERWRIQAHADVCELCCQLLEVTAALGDEQPLLTADLDSTERLALALSSGLRATTFSEGKRLAQRFEVTRFVDRGGMGEVYEAFDTVVGARVAIKALHCSARGSSGTHRLGEEVKLARRIAHPNVCRIHDLHEHREPPNPPLRFVAMEFVDGITLKERLSQGPLALDDACTIARQLLLGLGAVHTAGVLHLDFKSQNVMLRRASAPVQAVVMDFGLSRAFEQELRLRTSERHVAGSIGYMSPEQLECQPTLGPAADVYAFGVVFYEMLTGQMPFQADNPAAIILKQLKSRAAPPSRIRAEVPAALDEFVLTCLSRQARARYQSAASALEALERCPPSSSPQEQRRAHWLRLSGVVGLTALLTGSLVHLAWRMAATAKPVPPDSEVKALRRLEPTSPEAASSSVRPPAQTASRESAPRNAEPREPAATEPREAITTPREAAEQLREPERQEPRGQSTTAPRAVTKMQPRDSAAPSRSDDSAASNAVVRPSAVRPQRALGSGKNENVKGRAPTPRPAPPPGSPPSTPPKEHPRAPRAPADEQWVPQNAPNFLL